MRRAALIGGVRTPFGHTGEGGLYRQTPAEHLLVVAIRELLRRHPQLPADAVDVVLIAPVPGLARAGVELAGLRGRPVDVPADLMHALRAGTRTISTGEARVVIAGAVGHRPAGEEDETDLVPVATRDVARGYGLAVRDEAPSAAGAPTRGAACFLLTDPRVAGELGMAVRMWLPAEDPARPGDSR
jgi:hypothetical protein